jgi:hypothetical protein
MACWSHSFSPSVSCLHFYLLYFRPFFLLSSFSSFSFSFSFSFFLSSFSLSFFSFLFFIPSYLLTSPSYPSLPSPPPSPNQAYSQPAMAPAREIMYAVLAAAGFLGLVRLATGF